jgi:7-cyano-7-deazaguanine tRNA-ribosyltransferase
LEEYNFAGIIDSLITAKKNLPVNKPLHAFGVGLPMFFSLAAAVGVDLFDSASYALYAEDGRYMTVTGTRRIKNLEYFPCSCPICSSTDPQALRELPRQEQIEKLARHNLYIITQELKEVKQAIREGQLAELIENRAASHPKLLKAVHHIYKNSEWLEKFDPVTKRSGFMYTGPLSTKRPAVLRHNKKLMSKFFPSGRVVNIKLTPIGIVPAELQGIYPMGQCEYPEEEKFNWDKKDFLQKYKLKEGDAKPSVMDELKARAKYQFGKGGEELLHGAKLEFSRSTNRVRRIKQDGKLLATVRAMDGFIVPTIYGANLLHKSLKGMRVAVSDGEEFILQGKSVMAKFVADADPEIRPGDEVLVVNKQDHLLGVGKALLNREEMLAFKTGVAVKIRTKIE